MQQQRNAFAPKVNDTQRAQMEALYEQFAVVMQHLKIRWSPCAGSLLAIYRHNDWLIPWDDDIDVALHIDDEDRFEQFAQSNMLPGNLSAADCGYRTAEQGRLYKVFSNDAGLVYKKFTTDRFGNKVAFSFPFVDVWIRCKDPGDKQMSVATITPQECLMPCAVRAGRVLMHVPTRGQRAVAAFAERPDLMQKEVDVPWVHAEQRNIKMVADSADVLIAHGDSLDAHYAQRPAKTAQYNDYA